MKYSIMCGSFRSGTSICSIILSKHSEILYTDELWAYRSPSVINNKIKRLNDRYPNLVGRPYIQEELLGNNYDSFLQEWRVKPITSTVDLTNRLLKYTPKTNVKIYGDKLPEYIFDLEILQNILDKPKVLTCIRDGRDVIQSQIFRYNYYMKMQGTVGNHFWCHKTVNECISAQRTWLSYMKKWREIKNKIDYYEINYNELISNPEKVGLEIAKFLEVNEKEMKNIFKENIHSKRKNIWKEYLPNINDKLPQEWKSMLKEYGFET